MPNSKMVLKSVYILKYYKIVKKGTLRFEHVSSKEILWYMSGDEEINMR